MKLTLGEMKLTLGKKLGLGFASVLFLMILGVGLTFVKVGGIKDSQDHTLNVRFPGITTSKDLQRDLNQTASETRQAILAGADSARREEAKKAVEEVWNNIDEQEIATLDVLAPNWTLQANRDRYDELKKLLPALREAEEAAIKRAATGERDAISKAGDEFSDNGIPINNAIKLTLGDMADSFDELLQQETQRLNSETRSMNLTMLAGTLAAVLIGTFVAVFLSRSISGASHSVLMQAEAIAAGDLTREELRVRSRDELGDLTMAINKMSGSLKHMIMAIEENAVQVASASEELNATSQQITTNSEETSAQVMVVSQSAQAVNQNLQTVATGAEEMGASIKDIARNATEAAQIANSAVKAAESANTTVSKLGDSSAEIGQVIKVITSIAQQTNLLALNATIEAARAGEAGKGFAVVANEVKELAKKTAKATEDISRKIETIQVDTKAAVESIGTISEVINKINDISSTIATAVEEQNATTNEMARNVSEAAQGSGEITRNIAGVSDAAESTSHGAGDTQKAAQQLVATSAELRRLVEQFKVDGDEHARENAAGATAVWSRAAHA